MSDNNGNNGGIGLAGALGLLFIGLKLGHVIDWSWWLVTLPLWGGAALVVAILALVALFGGGAAAVKASRRRALARMRANPSAGSGRRMSIGERRDGGR